MYKHTMYVYGQKYACMCVCMYARLRRWDFQLPGLSNSRAPPTSLNFSQLGFRVAELLPAPRAAPDSQSFPQHFELFRAPLNLLRTSRYHCDTRRIVVPPYGFTETKRTKTEPQLCCAPGRETGLTSVYTAAESKAVSFSHRSQKLEILRGRRG